MTQLIAKQHILPSTVWMAEHLQARGNFEEIVFSGKHYSTIPEANASLCRFADVVSSDTEIIARIGEAPLLLLDEGGGLHAALPELVLNQTVVVEQTTFGLQANWRCPAVLVCRSAAKLLFESQIIARALIRKLDSLGLGADHRFAVVGLGALGSALMRGLLSRGASVRGFDIRPAPPDLAPWSGNLRDVLEQADVVLGCTGTDSLAGFNLAVLSGRKTFASCSSGRVEFAALTKVGGPCRYETFTGASGRLEWALLNGGYPINFDRSLEWELFEEIVLTRHLMLEGASQAVALFEAPPRGYMLNPAKQYELVTAWLEQVPDRADLLVPPDLSETFFRVHSEGEYVMATRPYQLHSTTPGALSQMRAHEKSYDTEVMGLPIQVDPGVWSPAYDWSSLFYVENIKGVSGRSFLEIGSGTGVISVFAGRDGAAPIVAVDANPAAVENTRRNFERYGLKDAKAILSEGFDAVRGRFDVVVWNAPYHGSRPADALERGCADEDYRGIRGFFRDIGDHLNPGGRVIFGFSESGDLPLIETLIKEAGFQIVRKLSDWRQNYNCILYDLSKARPLRDGLED